MSEMHWPKITKDTPLTEVKRIHQAIWDYVIEHGEKPDEAFAQYTLGCSVCEYAKLVMSGQQYKAVGVCDDFGNIYTPNNFCLDCPIKWPNNQYCPSRNSIYRRWTNENDSFRKSNIAKQIRDLPFKYELEEKKNV